MQISILLVLTAKLIFCKEVDYCAESPGCPIKHLLCESESKSNEDCGPNVAVHQMTLEDKSLILKVHNEKRNDIAGGSVPGWPEAANMMEMKWNDQIETVCSRWVAKCKHNGLPPGCSITSLDRFNSLGFILNEGTKIDITEKDFALPIENWYGEISSLSASIVDSYQGEKKEFSQVIWAKSYEIGCGYVTYQENKFIFICGYAEAGNIMKKEVYEKGKPCETCVCSNTYINLCTDEPLPTTTTPMPTTASQPSKKPSVYVIIVAYMLRKLIQTICSHMFN